MAVFQYNSGPVKKITFFVLFLLLGSFFAWGVLFQNPKQKTTKQSSVTTPTPPGEPQQMIDLEVGKKLYRATWFKVSNLQNLILHPNFEEKLKTKEIMTKGNCDHLVSAGFYTQEHQPIGLFVSEGQKKSEKVKSSLLDGVFTIDDRGTPHISTNELQEQTRLALQSGPILFKEGMIQNLTIRNDEPARRIVVAITQDNDVYFLAFYNNEAAFQGPLLAQLPKAVKIFQEKTKIKLWEALNLDGGTASAFYSESVSLSEIASVGSYFCIKN